MTREVPGQDPVDEARGKLFDVVKDPSTTVIDALGAFRAVKIAKKEIGMSGIDFLVGLREDATAAQKGAVVESVAAAFGAISSAFNEGINAAVDQMGRRVGETAAPPSGKVVVRESGRVIGYQG